VHWLVHAMLATADADADARSWTCGSSRIPTMARAAATAKHTHGSHPFVNHR
jgi:hypothetical protein